MTSSVAAIWISGLIFALIHSFMASNRCKQWFEKEGMNPHQYRIGYSILSLLLTCLWVFFIYHLPDTALYHHNGIIMWGLIALQFTGALVIALSLRHVDSAAFIGLKPFPDHIEPFREEGIYRHMRHPMYSGIMLVMLASPTQSMNSLNLTLVVCLYFVAGSLFEERRMLHQHPEYDPYRKRVPAFIPWRSLFRRRESS